MPLQEYQKNVTIWSFIQTQNWHWTDGQKHAPAPHVLPHQISSHLGTITVIYKKILTPRVPLFKVTGTDTDWSAVYDFLLVFWSNHGPSSYCFWDKLSFLSKMANLAHPCVSNSHWGSSPWNFFNGVVLKKLAMPLPMVKEFDNMCIRFDTIPECITQTDGQTDMP